MDVWVFGLSIGDWHCHHFVICINKQMQFTKQKARNEQVDTITNDVYKAKGSARGVLFRVKLKFWPFHLQRCTFSFRKIRFGSGHKTNFIIFSNLNPSKLHTFHMVSRKFPGVCDQFSSNLAQREFYLIGCKIDAYSSLFLLSAFSSTFFSFAIFSLQNDKCIRSVTLLSKFRFVVECIV